MDMCRRLDALEANGIADPLEAAEVSTLRLLMSVCCIAAINILQCVIILLWNIFIYIYIYIYYIVMYHLRCCKSHFLNDPFFKQF